MTVYTAETLQVLSKKELAALGEQFGIHPLQQFPYKRRWVDSILDYQSFQLIDNTELSQAEEIYQEIEVECPEENHRSELNFHSEESDINLMSRAEIWAIIDRDSLPIKKHPRTEDARQALINYVNSLN